jgi:hypothetical protein
MSISEESFVRNALKHATFDDGRWVANQSTFNGLANAPLDSAVKAAVVTAVNIFVTKQWLPELELGNALKIITVDDARKFIARVYTADLIVNFDK